MAGVPKPGSAALKLWTTITATNVAVYRLSGGRIGGKWKRRNRILLLDHVGARSGKQRTTPVVYMRDGDDLVIVGSRGGSDDHPGWYHNLRAKPDATVQIGREKQDVTARVATDAERDRLWPLLVEDNPDFAGYIEHTNREFPILMLSPRRSET